MVGDSLREKMLEYLRATAEAAGINPDPQSPVEIAGAIINAFLSLLGIIFLCLIIYGGFIWMTSGGNEGKVIKAKDIIRNATIGLIIVLASYSITRFVFDSLLQ